MTETERIINLTDDQMFFYEKNIIHDIIHDYGFYSSVKRWVKNINNLKAFANQGFTIFVDDGNIDDGDSDDETEGGGDAGIWKGGMDTTNPNVKSPTTTGESVATVTEPSTLQFVQSPISSHVDAGTSILAEESSQLSSPIRQTALTTLFTDNSPESRSSRGTGTPPIEEGSQQRKQQVKKIKLTRSINTEFVNALKNFFVFNLFESLLKVIKRELPKSLINNDIKNEIIHDIFFSNLDFFYYYEDDENNIGDINSIIDDNNNNPKKFDFVIFLTNLLEVFEAHCEIKIKLNTTSESPPTPRRTEENTITIEAFIPIIFKELNNFLDYEYKLSKIRPDNDEEFTITSNQEFMNNETKPMLNITNTQQFPRVINDDISIGIIDYNIYQILILPDNVGMLEDQNGGTFIINTMKGGENEQIEAINIFLNDYKEALSDLLGTVTSHLTSFIESICNENSQNSQKREPFKNETVIILNTGSFDFLKGFFGKNNERIKDFLKEEKLKQKFETNLKKLEITFAPSENGKKFLFNLNTRQIRDDFCDEKSEIVKNIMEKYEKDLNGELAPCLKIIEDQKNKYIIEENKNKLEKLKRDGSDGLGDKKIVQENFLTAVAKLGLFLNEEYISQNLDPNVKNLCDLECTILRYYANGCLPKTPSYRDLDTKLYEAFKHFSRVPPFQNHTFNSETYMCKKNKLYMIDNAAALNPKRRKNCVFCPLTSVCDGMGQCTLGSQGEYKADNNNIEQGDMLFSVQNNNNTSYYKGKLELNRGQTSAWTVPTTAKYTIKYKGFRDKFPPTPGEPQGLAIDIETTLDINIETTLDINIRSSKIKDLEAHNVLKNTLVAILKFIVAQYDGNDPNEIAEYLTLGDDVFSNIVNIITEGEIKFKNTLDENGDKIIRPNNHNPNNPNNKPLNHDLLNTFFKILGKGAGDIFQEINAICKYGGYSGKNYYKPTGIINWIVNGDERGHAIRFFAAKDRPSACRFIFLTWFGDDNEINKKSLGGFIAENTNTNLIVQRNVSHGHQYELCLSINNMVSSDLAIGLVASGGGKANTKKCKQSQKHSRKLHKKTKKHKKMKHLKRSKKYSQSKKHKKTKKRKHG